MRYAEQKEDFVPQWNETKLLLWSCVRRGDLGQKFFLFDVFLYLWLFCVIYQWIKYGFDETLEQVQKHIIDTFSAGLSQNI